MCTNVPGLSPSDSDAAAVARILSTMGLAKATRKAILDVAASRPELQGIRESDGEVQSAACAALGLALVAHGPAHGEVERLFRFFSDEKNDVFASMPLSGRFGADNDDAVATPAGLGAFAALGCSALTGSVFEKAPGIPDQSMVIKHVNEAPKATPSSFTADSSSAEKTLPHGYPANLQERNAKNRRNEAIHVSNVIALGELSGTSPDELRMRTVKLPFHRSDVQASQQQSQNTATTDNRTFTAAFAKKVKIVRDRCTTEYKSLETAATKAGSEINTQWNSFEGAQEAVRSIKRLLDEYEQPAKSDIQFGLATVPPTALTLIRTLSGVIFGLTENVMKAVGPETVVVTDSQLGLRDVLTQAWMRDGGNYLKATAPRCTVLVDEPRSLVRAVEAVLANPAGLVAVNGSSGLGKVIPDEEPELHQSVIVRVSFLPLIH